MKIILQVVSFLALGMLPNKAISFFSGFELKLTNFIKNKRRMGNLFTIFYLVINRGMIGNLQAREAYVDNKAICEKENGVWRGFGNNCADNCESRIESSPRCLSKIMFSCHCNSKDRCWDGYKCAVVNKYRKTSEKLAKEHKKKKEAIEKKLKEKQIKKLREQNKTAISNVKPKGSTTINYKTEVKDKKPVDKIKEKDNNIKSKTEKEVKRDSSEKEKSCFASSGTWKEFGDGCADSCKNKIKSTICVAIPTLSCDCGVNKCWDGNKCILTNSYSN